MSVVSKAGQGAAEEYQQTILPTHFTVNFFFSIVYYFSGLFSWLEQSELDL